MYAGQPSRPQTTLSGPARFTARAEAHVTPAGRTLLHEVETHLNVWAPHRRRELDVRKSTAELLREKLVPAATEADVQAVVAGVEW